MTKLNDEMRTALAANQHEIWSHWMKYMFTQCEIDGDAGTYYIPREKVDRWGRQVHTDFYDLPESERRSDYSQADKVLKVLTDSGKSFTGGER